MRNVLPLLTRTAVILMVLAVPVMAQANPVEKQTWLNLILEGGGVIGILIICMSVGGLALIIEHATKF